jgi:hypothetical protein
MGFHVKMTLASSDAVMRELKREAAGSGRSMSELVESALRMLLHRKHTRKELPDLPLLDGGNARVDVARRSALGHAARRAVAAAANCLVRYVGG